MKRQQHPEKEDACNNFLQWTHVHGFRQLSLGKNRKYFKICWIIFLSLMFILMGYDISAKTYEYAKGSTSTWSDYGYIWDDTGLNFPALTVCPENSKPANESENICEKFAINVNGNFFENIETSQTMTDVGKCCTIKVEQTEIRIGVQNSLNAVMYPGIEEHGVIASLHDQEDTPILGINSNYFAKGTENTVSVKPTRIESNGIACFEDDILYEVKEDWKLNTSYSMNNCLYSNMLHVIEKDCGCQKLENCTEETAWECASNVLNQPYTHFQHPVYCLEGCSQTIFSSAIGSKVVKDMDMEVGSCQNWITQVQKECLNNDTYSLTNHHLEICSGIPSVSCSTNETSTNNPRLRQFARENLISIKIHYTEYWIETVHSYYIVTFKDLFDCVLLSMVKFFGCSLVTIPELLFFMFECYKHRKGQSKEKDRRKKIIPVPNQNPPPNNNFGIYGPMSNWFTIFELLDTRLKNTA